MLYPMLLLLLSCSGNPDDSTPSDSTGADSASRESSADSGEGDDSGETGETGETGPVTTWRCPDEMASVDVEGTLLYCVDRFEVVVNDGVAESIEGEVPSTGYRFDDVRTICAQTPVVVDGVEYGFKRLVGSDEWEDAADGTVGPGGHNYPYGDDFDEDKCATVNQQSEVVYESLFPAGSFPDCISDFGVLDASGNAHEWTDPGQVIDSDAFLAQFPSLEIDDEGALVSLGSDLSAITTDIAGARNPIRVDSDGRVVTATGAEDWNWSTSNPRGYVHGWGDDDGERMMVEVVPIDEPGGDAWLIARLDEDGEAVTDKRGGAYYTGSPQGYRLSDSYRGHPHDFSGTIGFRCSCDPVEIDSDP